MARKVSEAPIVLIHGIKGSHLAQTYDDSFDVIWSGVQHRVESIWDLELDEEGRVESDPWDIIAVMQIEKMAYGELLGKLRRNFPDVPAYIFRYDWRLDLWDTAHKFDEFLERLQQKTGQDRFRIVTHSMGGLILSAFLKLDPNRNLARVQRAVLAAPPFWGSIESMHSLVVGDTVRWGFHAPEGYRKIARTFPSAYQLVPGYPDAWNHPARKADIWNIDYWQKRHDYGTRDRRGYQERRKLMKRHLERAKEFHEKELLNFDDLPEKEKNKFLLLYGTGEKTRVKLRVRPYNTDRDVRYFFDFKDEDNWDKREDYGGDGTVSWRSALRYQSIPHVAVRLSEFSTWWPWMWDDKVKIRVAGFHGMFLSLDKVQTMVCSWLRIETKAPKLTWSGPIKP